MSSRSRSPERNDAKHYEGQNGNSGPPQDQDGGSGSEEVKLYIGNLDYSTDENRLRDEFGQFGSVTDVFLPMDRNTGRPRGFGFVTLSTRRSAEDAIQKMDQTELDGRTIRVNESKPRGEGPRGGGFGSRGGGGFSSGGNEDVKLYVGNLSYEATEDSVRGLFEQHGTVSDCFLPTDRETGKVRGFAFVTMPASEAEAACQKVDGQDFDGKTLRVNKAQPKGGGGGGGYSRGNYTGGGGYGGGHERGGYDRGGSRDGGDRGGYKRGGREDRGGYGDGGYDRGGYGGGGYERGGYSRGGYGD